ncbi:MAG: multiheme c-type cytochrome [Phycisphaerales bacterium JB038]
MKFTLAAIALLALTCTAQAQPTYVGDQSCSGCHANNPYTGFFDAYINSGHPWKIFRTQGMTPPPDNWPHSPVPPLPVVYDVQLEWSDVEYVIGNFYWKARFIDRDGYIYTGDVDETTQWNLLTQEFVPYHAGELDKPFNCGRCHTTGYDEFGGNQHGLPGLIGTWAQDGVRCEACHGPSSEHIGDPFNTPPPGGKECNECHYRDAQFRMPWKGGFMRHHQQGEDLAHSAHKDIFDCSTCHNPHRSVVYNDGGTTKECSDCHEGDLNNSYYKIDGMEDLACVDCHMPFMAKSGQTFNAYTGDVRGHLFQIMTDPIAAADNVYDVDGSLFWNQDLDGESYVTLDYACIGCHIDLGDDLTLNEASVYSQNIHTAHAACVGDLNGDGERNQSDLGILLAAYLVNADGDVDGDGDTDQSDLGILLSVYNIPCP